MNISAILVTTLPANTEQLINTLNKEEGLEVFHHSGESGKIIAVQEAETINEEVSGLKKIKKIPGVIMAEMMQHYFAEDSNLYPHSELEKLNTENEAMSGESYVPGFLNE